MGNCSIAALLAQRRECRTGTTVGGTCAGLAAEGLACAAGALARDSSHTRFRIRGRGVRSESLYEERRAGAWSRRRGCRGVRARWTRSLRADGRQPRCGPRAARACEAIRARQGDEAARIGPLHILAYADYIAGDDDAARAGFHRTLEMGRRLGIRHRQAQEMTNLCSVETRAGNLDEADSLGQEALEISVELDLALLLPYCVINLAGVASAREHHERAAYLLGAGDCLLAAAGWDETPARGLKYPSHGGPSTAGLGEGRFGRHYDAGRALTR